MRADTSARFFRSADSLVEEQRTDPSEMREFEPPSAHQAYLIILTERKMHLKQQLKIKIDGIVTTCEISGVEQSEIIATLAIALIDICKKNDIPMDTMIAAIFLTLKLKKEKCQ